MQINRRSQCLQAYLSEPHLQAHSGVLHARAHSGVLLLLAHLTPLYLQFELGVLHLQAHELYFICKPSRCTALASPPVVVNLQVAVHL